VELIALSVVTNRLFRLRSTSLVQTPASLVEWNQLLVSATLNKPGVNARFACCGESIALSVVNNRLLSGINRFICCKRTAC